jgi:hypothetical protein
MPGGCSEMSSSTLNTMTDRCPYCGGRLPRRPVGRPRLQVPVKNVLHALSEGISVTAVAQEFGISRASVYRIRDRMNSS